MRAWRALARVTPSHFMAIDAATRRNLELTQTLSGARSGSLLSVIDRTVTAAGARELAARLAAPLTDVKAIAARHGCGGASFAGDSELRRRLREALRSAPDHRPRAGAAVGGARRPARSRQSARRHQCGARLARQLWRRSTLPRRSGDARWTPSCKASPSVSRLSDRLELLLVDEPPYLARDGGFIKSGVACAAG